MKPLRLPPARLGLADIAILCLLGGVIAVVVSFAREFEAPFSQAVRIDLSPAALPWYTLYSLSRGVLALLISYLFALGFGWAAAKSPAAERLLLPLLDILQSIPVLGFLPGLVLGLMSLFPTRNVGLELAAILMIFTAQAWNLALSFYNSLKALPPQLRDACKVAGWPPGRTFRQLEVPAAAQGLVWNGMLSMAGGWFFLMVNEAFRLGNRDYRLPGIGSYMSVALDQGNLRAAGLAITAMVVMIVCVDQLLWRPLVVWVEKFRLDESGDGGPAPSSWVLEFLRRARLPRGAAVFQRISRGLGLGAVALMVLAGQWYILFNVISAVAAIPQQLKDATAAFRLPRWRRWRALYLPAAAPALVMGWVTAAGGAWNGSIVAEYIEAGGALRTTKGLGSLISEATADANFPLLAGGIALMSLIVVGWNRIIWRSLMEWARTRFGYAQ